LRAARPVGSVTQVSTPVIRRLDPDDDADMDGFQEVYVAAELAEDPDAALYSREDGIAILTATGSGSTGTAYGAFREDVMVGEALVTWSLIDNLDVARVWIWVHPAHQRAGIGTRLAARAHAEVAGLGRHVCQATARIGPDRAGGNRAFAESLGYTLANVEVARRAPLPTDPGLLERLEREAAPHHRAYAVRTGVGPVPEELAPSYVDLKNLIAVEAPSGSLEVEAQRATVAELAVRDRELAASGRTRMTAYALDPHGVVVAYSDAVASRDGFEHVDQWGTIVHPDHRGHRLGTAVKCALLRTVSQACPGKRFIETTNAESNRHMVAINQALGFEVAQVYGDFQRRLDLG